MARAVDETRKTLMAVSTFCDTMILKENLSLKMINQNNHYLQSTCTIIPVVYTIKVLSTCNHN